MGVRRVLEETFDYEIVDEFLDHFAMSTDAIELLTVQLEKPEYYDRNVNELFRIFHNIKSATGFLQIKPINKFAIEVEELLEKMRQKKGPAQSDIVDWLLACDDHMTMWNDNLRMDEELAPLPDILKQVPNVE